MSVFPEFFSASFWEEVSELDELGRRAYADYLSARDALFACHGRQDLPDLEPLWSKYCEAAALLERVLAETQVFTGQLDQGN